MNHEGWIQVEDVAGGVSSFPVGKMPGCFFSPTEQSPLLISWRLLDKFEFFSLKDLSIRKVSEDLGSWEDTILFFLARTFWRLYSFRLFGLWYQDQTRSIPGWTALGFSLKLKQLKQPWRISILYLKQKLIDSLVSSLKQSPFFLGKLK